MDLKGAGKSPMAFVTKSKQSVTTPTRKSFLQKLAEQSAAEEEKQEEPPVEEKTTQQEQSIVIEDDFDQSIGRISPIRIEKDIEIPNISTDVPKTPEIPTLVQETEEQPRVETITREHLSPVKTNFVDVDDEDDILERVNDLINDPGKIDYNLEQEEVRNACIETFKSKFQNLKLNYPEHGIEYPEGKSLNKIHDTYHSIIKSIYVNMNLGQLQLGYIIVLMAIEFVCVKAFNVPLAGFTKMELKRMHRYNQLMVELGENLYSVGSGSWPIEWRILGTLVMNIVIFVALKFLASYVGGESMTEVIRNAVDQVLDNPVTKDNIETGNVGSQSKTAGNGLGSMMEGMMSGGNGNGMADLIASLGTGFTEKMEKSSKTSASKAKKRRFVFED
jgi:hypothetical protein